MPEDDSVWLPREDLLRFEEISALVDLFVTLGVDKVRLTGGEPLLRRDLPRLIRLLLQNHNIREIALTTNGILLPDHAEALYQAGLNRVTVSLDTLRPERFRQLTRRDEFARVLEGIESAGRAGFTGLKLDTVAIRGFNDDELVGLIEFGKHFQAEVRFTVSRDRVVRIRVVTRCQGQAMNLPFKGTWRLDGDKVVLTFPTKGKQVTAAAIQAGTARPPLNADRMDAFVARDEAFHALIEATVEAAQRDDIPALRAQSDLLREGCIGCHEEFRGVR